MAVAFRPPHRANPFGKSRRSVLRHFRAYISSALYGSTASWDKQGGQDEAVQAYVTGSHLPKGPAFAKRIDYPSQAPSASFRTG